MLCLCARYPQLHLAIQNGFSSAGPSATFSFSRIACVLSSLTSESVNEGHPDKICDQVSDAILDACLEQDPQSKVARETCTETYMVIVFREITTKAKVNYEKIADVDLDANKYKVLVNIKHQSPDTAQGVHGFRPKKKRRAHVRLRYDETPELMTLTHVLATKLTEVRKNKTCPLKLNIYFNTMRVHTVLISTQHNEKHVIKPVIPPQSLDNKTIFSFNPLGRFVIGGTHGDAGHTGRKILIDTYGGCGAHGSGAFLGKDPTKVDRSGAYIVRQAAKSVVASGLARRCIVQVSYAIGVPDPVSVFVDTYKTGKIRDKDILALIKENFDFRPGMISIDLDLTRGVNFRYQKTAAYGHFGRDDPDFTWETLKLLKPRKA
ncbi:hypothetical protein ACJRO7_003336 [Eucalyptus globulus]|uniref:S-adenosylmethionine synthase n=1 Tax=Eucalyptus globulus TaxID=34317 RepID=A0ABD3IVA5_EUCGL